MKGTNAKNAMPKDKVGMIGEGMGKPIAGRMTPKMHPNTGKGGSDAPKGFPTIDSSDKSTRFNPKTQKG